PMRWRWFPSGSPKWPPETSWHAWCSRADGAAQWIGAAAPAAPPRPLRLAAVAPPERGLADAVGGDCTGWGRAAQHLQRVCAPAQSGCTPGPELLLRGGVSRGTRRTGDRRRGDPGLAALGLGGLLDQ